MKDIMNIIGNADLEVAPDPEKEGELRKRAL